MNNDYKNTEFSQAGQKYIDQLKDLAGKEGIL